MPTILYRLLGSEHNRLLEVIPGEAKVKCAPGQIVQHTAGQLQSAGWSPYDGPGKAVAGWYVDGTDERLRPTGRHEND